MKEHELCIEASAESSTAGRTLCGKRRPASRMTTPAAATCADCLGIDYENDIAKRKAKREAKKAAR